MCFIPQFDHQITVPFLPYFIWSMQQPGGSTSRGSTSRAVAQRGSGALPAPPPLQHTVSSRRWGILRLARPSTVASSMKYMLPQAPNEGEEVLASGTIVFNNANSMIRTKSEAKFAVVDTSIAVEQLMELLDGWQMQQPSVLISVTGSANLSVSHVQEEYVRNGLASAARATNAWVFTGGMDTGVMALTGSAMQSMNLSKALTTPCIGIAPWRKVGSVCVTIPRRARVAP